MAFELPHLRQPAAQPETSLSQLRRPRPKVQAGVVKSELSGFTDVQVKGSMFRRVSARLGFAAAAAGSSMKDRADCT